MREQYCVVEGVEILSRNIDLLIATKVMEWKESIISMAACPKVNHPIHEGCSIDVPDFSTNVEDSWKVVEKLKSDFEFSITSNGDLGWIIDADDYHDEDRIIPTVYEKSLPLGICLIALRCKNIENS